MKQMTYGKDRKIELLDTGKYLGFTYYILNLGTHPTAYIKIPENHKYYEKDYDEINLDVHGGLTYSSKQLCLENEVIEGWFIGWDYAHYGDYLGYEEMFSREFRTNGKKWTTEEILKEVKEACRKLLKEE